MKYECNWCNHTRPCVVEYSGSNECKPDRCMISPEQAGAFELVEDHECEWERSEILDIELKAAQKNEEAPETIDNKERLAIALIDKLTHLQPRAKNLWSEHQLVNDILDEWRSATSAIS